MVYSNSGTNNTAYFQMLQSFKETLRECVKNQTPLTVRFSGDRREYFNSGDEEEFSDFEFDNPTVIYLQNAFFDGEYLIGIMGQELESGSQVFLPFCTSFSEIVREGHFGVDVKCQIISLTDFSKDPPVNINFNNLDTKRAKVNHKWYHYFWYKITLSKYNQAEVYEWLGNFLPLSKIVPYVETVEDDAEKTIIFKEFTLLFNSYYVDGDGIRINTPIEEVVNAINLTEALILAIKKEDERPDGKTVLTQKKVCVRISDKDGEVLYRR